MEGKESSGLTKKELKKLKKKEKKQKMKQNKRVRDEQEMEDEEQIQKPTDKEQQSFVRHGVKRTRRFDNEEANAPAEGEEESTTPRKNSGSDFEDQFEDEFEEEIKVEPNDEEWEDVDDEHPKIIEVREEDEEMKDEEEEKIDTASEQPKEPIKQGVWLGNEKPAQDEELVYENSAYEMIHRATVEWPSLSVDVLLEDRFKKDNYSDWFPQYVHKLDPSKAKKKLGKHDKTPELTQENYPYNAYVVAGSQAEKKQDNKIYVMKWSNLYKTLHEDEEDDAIIEGEGDEEEAKLYYEGITHFGGVNRIRSMHGSNIVATWSDECEVSIFDINQAISRLEIKYKAKSNSISKKKYSSLICKFKHKMEGFALDWSPLRLGLLASGGCDKNIFLYEPTGTDYSEFKMHSNPLKGHKDSVEDIQFSPKQDYVLASCSVDKTVKLWDLRENKWKPQMSFVAHDSDVNVISWNTECPYLIASGCDDGSFKVWDLRKLQKDLNAKPITNIKWHNAPITSIQFQPREECVLAVSSADNRLTIWDFSVEPETQKEINNDIPPQLMFLHQGQENIKELRFHHYHESVIITTAEDSFNIFKPNFDPDQQYDEDSEGENEERLVREQAKELQKQLDAMQLE